MSFFPGSQIKNQTVLSVYHRPTIPWSLECEINRNFTRLDAIKYFKARFQLVQQLPKTIIGFAIPSLIFVIIIPFRVITEFKGKNAGVAMLFICGFAFIFAASFMAKPTMVAWRAWKKQEA